jgi:hypothetical protein
LYNIGKKREEKKKRVERKGRKRPEWQWRLAMAGRPPHLEFSRLFLFPQKRWRRSSSDLTTTQRRKEKGEKESIEGRNEEVGVEDGDCDLIPRKWLPD